MTQPLTPPDCDCTDLDGFMLNVERLMASELVALSSHEIVAAALFVWCRAWKQRPAASLPDDDRVIAAFCKLPVAKFRKFKSEILRGFTKCSDGRLYHKTLAEEALRAYAKKLAFQKRRSADAERLRNWRDRRGETHTETRCETKGETIIETRFVAEGQGQGQGQGQGESKSSEPNGSGGGAANGHESLPAWWPVRDRYGRIVSELTEKIMFDVGKAVLGKSSGGQITRLRKCYRGNLRAVVDLLLQAHEKSNAGEWFASVVRNAERDEMPTLNHEKYPEHSYAA